MLYWIKGFRADIILENKLLIELSHVKKSIMSITKSL